MTDPLSPSIRPLFRAVAEGFLAPAREYDEGEWTRAEGVVVDALRDRSPAMVRQVQLFLRLVNLLPLVTRGRTLRRLSPEERGVHGLPWLRVADASLVPDALQINPYLTIMALADRVAEGVRGDLGSLAAPTELGEEA